MARLKFKCWVYFSVCLRLEDVDLIGEKKIGLETTGSLANARRADSPSGARNLSWAVLLVPLFHRGTQTQGFLRRSQSVGQGWIFEQSRRAKGGQKYILDADDSTMAQSLGHRNE
jgi:hypothetical protein